MSKNLAEALFSVVFLASFGLLLHDAQLEAGDPARWLDGPIPVVALAVSAAGYVAVRWKGRRSS